VRLPGLARRALIRAPSGFAKDALQIEAVRHSGRSPLHVARVFARPHAGLCAAVSTSKVHAVRDLKGETPRGSHVDRWCFAGTAQSLVCVPVFNLRYDR
jgi:hypothetical protein